MDHHPPAPAASVETGVCPISRYRAVRMTPQRKALIERFTTLLGQPPPKGASSARMHKEIDYAERLAADPGLARIDKEVNQRLRALARQPRSKRQTPQPGSRLLREWGGELHEVTVTDGGYAYRGIVYTSLTAVAIRITGTRWSGPRFFGTS